MTRAERHIAYAERKCTELIDTAAKLRQDACLSQREVCDALGLTSHGNLTLIEKHKSVPTLDRFLRILSVLGFTLKIVPKTKNPGDP